MKSFFLGLFSVFSRLINVLSGGSADLTFSARSHIDKLWSEKWIDKAALKIFGEQNHCKVWWDYEVKRSKVNVSRSKE